MGAKKRLSREALAVLTREMKGITVTAMAKRLGVSRPTVALLLSGKYPASAKKMETLIMKQFENRIVACPVLADIPARRCAKEREKKGHSANPLRAQLGRSCPGCSQNPEVV